MEFFQVEVLRTIKQMGPLKKGIDQVSPTLDKYLP